MMESIGDSMTSELKHYYKLPEAIKTKSLNELMDLHECSEVEELMHDLATKYPKACPLCLAFYMGGAAIEITHNGNIIELAEALGISEERYDEIFNKIDSFKMDLTAALNYAKSLPVHEQPLGYGIIGGRHWNEPE